MLVAANIYSIFQPLTDVFESVLKFFHDQGGISWGFSIMLLTVCVRAVLIPLTLRQMKSMVRMQAFAPQMKAIQAKYKEDKARQQQEIMKFYKENDLHPLGSCLPMVLQLPAFFALYAMLRQSLRGDICPKVQIAHNHGVLSNSHTIPCGDHGAGFLFIHDLTDKATGITLVVLLILYVGSQLGSSLLMSSAAMEKSQRQIMLIMPLFFVAFIFRFPAGLLVYWITTNLWTVGQQYIIKRQMGAHQVAAAGAAASAGAAAGVVPAPAGGSGDSSGGGGGLGSMLRNRLREAQESADARASGGGGGAGTATKTKPSNGSGSGAKTKSVGSGRATKPKASGSPRAKSSGGGNGSGNGASGSDSGASGSGNGSALSGSGAAPPRPPRKKKKRSGRRR